ncbi:fumarate hydratase [Pedobacter flavus]|uniref:Fumarate hydratase n=1 Tax=Pedobacter flavus TaxID=3113906 RepID=A0ABU7GYZ2_9SPHI|nr:fumarate hydratase [Pedobacter sp. VNH31]MEE1884287.1 fumarate hydratase [Pedobacter sp. VNH31]
MRNLLFIFFLFLSIVVGCKRLPDIQGEGYPQVQGVWIQDAIDTDLKNYTLHKFKFSCDSFYLELLVKNQINHFNDTCATNGDRKEYAKGIYALKGDSLFLKGTYTKENYKQKISGCYNIGSYRHNFLLLKSEEGKMSMRDLSNNLEANFTQTEKSTCTPKPL